MIPALPEARLHRLIRWFFLLLIFAFIGLPLLVVGVFAFNDAPYPMPPWQGFTLDWFVAHGTSGRVGILGDDELLASLGNSVVVAIWVSGLSVTIGTANAWLLERAQFRGKAILTVMTLVPLVIPGVILGISILAFMSRIAQGAEDLTGWEFDALRPGLPLVVMGQFAYIVSIASLTIGARLKRFDRSLEDAAANLGAGPFQIFHTLLLPFLRPALFGAGAVAFLLSFENFNTSYMLVGSDAPLTILLYGRMKEGATPVVNAISLGLMLLSGIVVAVLQLRGRREPA